MTSARYNARQRFQQEEMAIFDALPAAVRQAIAQARGSVRASSARDALLRGATIQQVCDIIAKGPFVHTKTESDQ
jgi:hypothetical protein